MPFSPVVESSVESVPVISVPEGAVVPVVELSPLELVDASELVVVPPVLESALPDVVPLVSDVDDSSLELLVPVVPSAGALSERQLATTSAIAHRHCLRPAFALTSPAMARAAPIRFVAARLTEARRATSFDAPLSEMSREGLTGPCLLLRLRRSMIVLVRSIVTRAGLSTILLAELAACGVEVSSISAPVWSDDGEMVAFEVNWSRVPRRQVDEAPSDRKDWDEEDQLFIVDAEQENAPISITGRGNGLGPYYFMRSAGYLVVQEAATPDTLVRQIFLEGEDRVIARGSEFDPPGVGDGWLEAIPSPNGEFIVLWGRDEDDAVVTVLDAHSLAELVPKQVVAAGTLTWSVDGPLVVWGAAEGQAQWWTPGTTELVPGPAYTCNHWPPTTSSYIAADGTFVLAGEDFDDPLRFTKEHKNAVAGKNRPFGCPE